MKSRLDRMLGAGRPPDQGLIRDGSLPAGGSLSRIPGGDRDRGDGPFWMCIEDFPLTHFHGRRSLGELLRVDPGRLSLLAGDPRLAGFTPERACFLDTETTSLSGGGGVRVFMVGLGFIEGDRFRVEQYFMRDFHEEEAMMAAFNRSLTRFDAMVSFFGKNFDRYRLEDRMLALGLESNLPVDCHLDLYHVGRRLYKERFHDKRLKTLEVHLLDFARTDDLPGAECPEAYFTYLQGRDSGRMARVFQHNLLDILSLVSLAVETDALARNPATALDRYALACVKMKAGLAEEARALLERACPDLEGEPEAFDARCRLVKLLKRAGLSARLEEGILYLVALRPEDPEVLTEAAKFYEHRSKDFGIALEYARKARRALEAGDDGSARWERRLRECARRIARLTAKREK